MWTQSINTSNACIIYEFFRWIVEQRTTISIAHMNDTHHSMFVHDSNCYTDFVEPTKFQLSCWGKWCAALMWVWLCRRCLWFLTWLNCITRIHSHMQNSFAIISNLSFKITIVIFYDLSTCSRFDCIIPNFLESHFAAQSI